MPRIRRSNQTPGSAFLALGPGFELGQNDQAQKSPIQNDAWVGESAIRCLERTPPPRVTMIAAPAGSGKIALVEHWLYGAGSGSMSGSLSRSPARGWVWVDFDPADRADPDGVERAIGQALREVADLGDLIALGQHAHSGDPVLVLAGLEVLSAEQQTQLVGRLPAGLRVILISAGLGLPAGCLVRLAGDLAELRSAHLWWSPAEIGLRLSRLTGVETTPEECRQLHDLTAGWPAVVIILSRAMRLRRQFGADPGVAGDDPIHQPGTDPDVLDFATGETLDHLDAALRTFVLRTSVLTELGAGPCGALVPQGNPHAMLAEAERQGLVETAAESSRYHPLVRAAALRALRCEQPEAEAELLRAAARYAVEHHQPEAAVSCLVAAEAWEQAVELLGADAPSGFAGYSPGRLRQLLDRLPDHVWAQDAERRARFAFAAAISGDQLRCAEVIRHTPNELTESLTWWNAVTRTILAFCAKPAAGPRSAYRVALTALDEVAALPADVVLPSILGVADRPALEGLAHLLAARAGLFDGDPLSVRRHLSAGWAVEGAQLPRYAVLAGLGTQALASAWDGSLPAAERRADRAHRLAAEAGLVEHPLAGLSILAEVEVLRARGRSTEALSALTAAGPGLHRSEPFVAATSGGQLHTAAERILRATLLLDRADPAGAAAELEAFAASGDDDLPAVLEAARRVVWARLHLVGDDVAAAELVLRAAAPGALVAGTRIQIALHRQAVEEACAVLQNWPVADTVDNRVRHLLATTAIDLALDRRTAADRALAEALALAEPEGLLQVFLDAGNAVRVLTSVLLGRSLPASPWRQELADRLDDLRLVGESVTTSVTRRELAVLEQLTTSLTHAQIAGGMFVSENTLKSHCRNLYRKLGVNSRADAVRAARARGWLAPVPARPAQSGQPGPNQPNHPNPNQPNQNQPNPNQPNPNQPNPNQPTMPVQQARSGRRSSTGDVVLDVNITPVPVVVEL